MNSTLIATALDLKRETATADFAHSLRAGTGALRVALSSVESGAAKNMLVAIGVIETGRKLVLLCFQAGDKGFTPT